MNRPALNGKIDRRHAGLIATGRSWSRSKKTIRSMLDTQTAQHAALNVRFRRGTTQDVESISSALRKEKMNPVGVDPTRFLIAEDEQGLCLGFGQLEQKDTKAYELRSLVVVKETDRGKGIGQAVVQALMETLKADDQVWLTTIKSAMGFYEKLGFQGRQVDLALLGRIPRWLLMEAIAGAVVAPVTVQQPLCIMCRHPGEGFIPGPTS